MLRFLKLMSNKLQIFFAMINIDFIFFTHQFVVMKFEAVEDTATNTQSFFTASALELCHGPLTQLGSAVEAVGFARIAIFL